MLKTAARLPLRCDQGFSFSLSATVHRSPTMRNPLYQVGPNQHSGCSSKPWLRVRWRSDQPPGSKGKQHYLADMFALKQNVSASVRVKTGEISIFGYSRLYSR